MRAQKPRRRRAYTVDHAVYCRTVIRYRHVSCREAVVEEVELPRWRLRSNLNEEN